MANIGYVRVSTIEQNTERQEKNLSERADIDKWFIEKISGKNTQRKQLAAMIDYARSGDTIYIDSFSRLARSTKDLLSLIEQFKESNIKLVSIKENLDTSTPQGVLMVTMIGAINQFEREQLLERQAEGIAIAKAKGVYKGRKKIEVTDELKDYYQQWKAREITKSQIITNTGISRATIDRRFKELGAKC